MKKFVFFLLIGVSLLRFTDAEIEIPQPADLDLIENSHVLAEVEAAQKAVRNSPDDGEAWGRLGHVYLIYGWTALTEPCYRRASILAPAEFRWYYFLGRVTSHSNPEAAVDIFTRALQLDATYAPAHLYLASALRALRRFEQAEHHLERAKHLQPDNPLSDLWLGEIALAKQEIKLAEEHLQRALSLNPNQSEAHAILSQVYFALKEHSFAKQHAQAARQPSQYTELADPLWWFEPRVLSSPKDAEAWIKYGMEFIAIKRYDDAVAALEQAQALIQSGEWEHHEKKTTDATYLRVRIHHYFGQIHYQQGRTGEAIQSYQQAIQIQEADASGVNATVSPQMPPPNRSERLRFFASVRANLAVIYEEVGQLEQAIKQYQKALSIVPTEPALHRNLAAIYWHQENYVAAEHHYKSVIAHDATDIQALDSLGFISLVKADYMEAVVRFERVRELDTTYIEAYRGLGIAHTELGNFLDAIIAFETLLALEPADPFAQEMLQRLKGVR